MLAVRLGVRGLVARVLVSLSHCIVVGGIFPCPASRSRLLVSVAVGGHLFGKVIDEKVEKVEKVQKIQKVEMVVKVQKGSER